MLSYYPEILFLYTFYRWISALIMLKNIEQFLLTMRSFFFTKPESIFWLTAIGGTFLFFLKVIAMFSGSLFDTDFDGLDVDTDGAGFDSVDLNDNSLFRFFSISSIAGFFMMFGWAGLAAFKQYGFLVHHAYMIALLAGIGLIYCEGQLFRLAFGLINHGGQYDLKDTIGKTAVVYHSIPIKGEGKIQITVGGATREILARTNDGKPISSFSIVCVVDVVNENIVLVTNNSKKETIKK